MRELIREVCILSIICGTVCSIAPESPVKTLLTILSAVILILSALRPVAELDLEAYSASLLKYRELEQRLNIDAENMSERLNRMVIEEEYRAYIKDKAEELGIELAGLKLEMSWNTDGYWMPVGVELNIKAGREYIPELVNILESQLGLSRERQKCTVTQ